MRLGDIYRAFLVFYLLALLAKLIFDLAGVLPKPVAIGIDIGVGVALVLLVPLLVAPFIPGPEQGAADQAARLRPLIDELAKCVDLDWEQHWTHKIDTAVREGDLGPAARAYREHQGATWDEAHQAVADWTQDECQRKLRALVKHLHKSST